MGHEDIGHRNTYRENKEFRDGNKDAIIQSPASQGFVGSPVHGGYRLHQSAQHKRNRERAARAQQYRRGCFDLEAGGSATSRKQIKVYARRGSRQRSPLL